MPPSPGLALMTLAAAVAALAVAWPRASADDLAARAGVAVVLQEVTPEARGYRVALRVANQGAEPLALRVTPAAGGVSLTDRYGGLCPLTIQALEGPGIPVASGGEALVTTSLAARDCLEPLRRGAPARLTGSLTATGRGVDTLVEINTGPALVD